MLWSAFVISPFHVFHSQLLDSLRGQGIKSVDIVGLAFDYCVKSTAIDAAKNKFHVRIIEDGTAGTGTDMHRNEVRQNLQNFGVDFVTSNQIFEEQRQRHTSR